jgi:hypothetical protein
LTAIAITTRNKFSLLAIESAYMTIVLSPEMQAKAEQIPDFAQRLERFINDQYTVEQWRTHQLKRVRTEEQDTQMELAYRDGHWVAIGELPAGFDFERFTEELREVRIRETAGL